MGKSWAFGNWPPWIAASRCKMTMVMPCFLRDFHNVRIRADDWHFIHCAVGTLRIECRCNINVKLISEFTINAKLWNMPINWTLPIIGPQTVVHIIIIIFGLKLWENCKTPFFRMPPRIYHVSLCTSIALSSDHSLLTLILPFKVI